MGLFGISKKKRGGYTRLNNNNDSRYVRLYNENVKKANKANSGVIKALRKLKINAPPLMRFPVMRIKGPSPRKKLDY